MVYITAGATEVPVSVLFVTMTEVLIGVVPFFATTTASTVLRHILSATPQVTVANLITKSAYDFILLILHGGITSVMPFFATDYAGAFPS